jgi:heme/copper-type cytochrome/quinol oxidase subunit 3
MEPAQLGLLFFIAAEVMFFAGLLSAFVAFRLGAGQWPPMGQPRLPVAVTGINTLILLFSGFGLYRASKVLVQDRYLLFLKWLEGTFWTGFLFLVIQGSEWVRMVGFGLTASSNVYGGFFYLLVGLHALHALGGFLVLGWVKRRARQGAYTAGDRLGLDLCRMYWTFVVGLWPVLYVLLYW